MSLCLRGCVRFRSVCRPATADSSRIGQLSVRPHVLGSALCVCSVCSSWTHQCYCPFGRFPERAGQSMPSTLLCQFSPQVVWLAVFWFCLCIPFIPEVSNVRGLNSSNVRGNLLSGELIVEILAMIPDSSSCRIGLLNSFNNVNCVLTSANHSVLSDIESLWHRRRQTG